MRAGCLQAIQKTCEVSIAVEPSTQDIHIQRAAIAVRVQCIGTDARLMHDETVLGHSGFTQDKVDGKCMVVCSGRRG